MRVHTSYYGKIAKASTENVILVRVSNTVPNWFDKDYKELMTKVYPSWDLINMFKNNQIDYQTFCLRYKQELQRRTTPERILMELKELCELYMCDTVVLLCWEKQWCHRTALADFINTDGVYCGEF